jgi:hypothetical protein
VSAQKKVFRFGSLGIGLAGIAAGTTFLVLASKSYDKWEAASDRALHEPTRENHDAYDQAQAEYNRNLALGIVLEGVGVLGCGGFTLTFVF